MLALFDSGRLRRPLSRREREVTSGRETKAAGGKRSSAGEGKGRGERETDLGFAAKVLKFLDSLTLLI